MSSSTNRGKSFKINPVEFVIFGAVLTAFSHSAYRLVYHWDDLTSGAQVAQTTPPTSGSPLAEGREPASVEAMTPNSIASKRYESLNFKCEDTTAKMKLAAHKVRLTGELCAHPEGGQLKKATIVNLANEAEATVFANTSTGEFTTDYIDLMPGSNVIAFHFEYQSRPPVEKEFVLEREVAQE